ncbi:MAG: ACT domain-containing protein [Anaerolineales bacterium]
MNSQQKIKVGGILEFRNLCLIGVMSAPDKPGLVAHIFQTLGEEKLNAQFIVQSIDLNDESHVQFCVAMEDMERTLAFLQPVAKELGARKITHIPSVAILSVFGPDFRERPGIAGVAFDALARVGINILAVSTSISTISSVIKDSDFDDALQALHHSFAFP